MDILYIQDRPIQNNLPFEILHQEYVYAFQVLFIRRNSNQTSLENINESVFDVHVRFPFPHIFLTENASWLSKLNLLYKSIRNAKVIVIYGYYSFWLKLAVLLAVCLMKKRVITTDATYLEGTAYTAKWKAKIKPYWLRFLLNKVANAVFVPSTASKEFLIQQGIRKNKIVLTPYTIDEQLFKSALGKFNEGLFRTSIHIDEQDFVFLFCAKFIQRKRPLDAVEAFHQLTNKYPNQKLKLVMIGDGPLKPAIEEYISQHQLQTSILLTGLVAYNVLPHYYAASNTLIFTSDHEPYGLPVNEALFCKTPVIASDQIGAAKDLIHPTTGWIYPCGDIEALTSKMEEAFSNSIATELKGVNGHKLVKHWDSRYNLQQQIQFFTTAQWL